MISSDALAQLQLAIALLIGLPSAISVYRGVYCNLSILVSYHIIIRLRTNGYTFVVDIGRYTQSGIESTLHGYVMCIC